MRRSPMQWNVWHQRPGRPCCADGAHRPGVDAGRRDVGARSEPCWLCSPRHGRGHGPDSPGDDHRTGAAWPGPGSPRDGRHPGTAGIGPGGPWGGASPGPARAGPAAGVCWRGGRLPGAGRQRCFGNRAATGRLWLAACGSAAGAATPAAVRTTSGHCGFAGPAPAAVSSSWRLAATAAVRRLRRPAAPAMRTCVAAPPDLWTGGGAGRGSSSGGC
mmetsp:Transcript_37644/g.118618  ORF Transcript_37644/g.118618 Transcript_37644/m.118618 type:complete len:216 (+) Transcript_37644:1048-1695(+)